MIELNNRITISKCFRSNKELAQSFCKGKPSDDNVNELAELSKLPKEFITVNIDKISNLANWEI